jgi:hypothetical protein
MDGYIIDTFRNFVNAPKNYGKTGYCATEMIIRMQYVYREVVLRGIACGARK